MKKTFKKEWKYVEYMYRIKNILIYLDPTVCEKSLSLLQVVCQDCIEWVSSDERYLFKEKE